MPDTIDLSTQPFDKVVELANEWRSLAKRERERRIIADLAVEYLKIDAERLKAELSAEKRRHRGTSKALGKLMTANRKLASSTEKLAAALKEAT